MGSQRGFALLELLMGVAVAGLLAPMVIVILFQVVWGTDTINGRTVALAEMHNVAGWLNQDLSMARELLDPATLEPLVKCGTGTQPSVRAEWIDETGWGAGDPEHVVEFYIEPGTTLLKRDYDGAVTIVGEHVTSLSFCLDAEGILHLDVVSKVGTSTPVTKALFFYVSPRPDEGT